MTASESSEMIRGGGGGGEGGGEDISSNSVVTSSPSTQPECHVVENKEARDVETGVEEEALRKEEFHLIEEIKNLNFLEDAPVVNNNNNEEDPMIFQPIFYGSGEFTPSITPPEPAGDFIFPPEMAQPIPWHPGSPQMQPFDPEMPYIVYPHGLAEMQPGPAMIPNPVELTQQNLAYHAYPIFQPIPTFVGQPFYHRRSGDGSSPSTPNRGNNNNNNNGNGNQLRECYNCRRPGHLARNCGEVASDKQCFHCLRFGHVVRNCPVTRNNQAKRDDPRMNNSLSSSPTYLEWSSDSGDPSSDCNDVSSPSIGSPMPTEFGCFNPPDYDVNPANARFYIIKSNSEQDIRASIEHGVWCSTDHGNKKLDNCFKNNQHNGPTILLFSVNNSGKFCGIAEMTSRVDFNKESGIWSNNRFRGQFRVRWSHVKDVPNSALRHIYLANNDFKPVTFSRDTQEVPPREGKRLLYILHKYCHVSSMLEPICGGGGVGGGGGDGEKEGRSDGEEEEEDASSSINLEDDEVQFQQRLEQHHHRQQQQHHRLRGGGGGGGFVGGEMMAAAVTAAPFPATIAYPHFPVPHTAFGGAPLVPYHIVSYNHPHPPHHLPGAEWNPEFQQQQPLPMQAVPYPAPLMGIPTPSPGLSTTSSEEAQHQQQQQQRIPQLMDNEEERRQLQRQQQQQQHSQQQQFRDASSPPQQPSSSPQHHRQLQQQHSPLNRVEIVNSLEEFPSLPKKAVSTPLNVVS